MKLRMSAQKIKYNVNTLKWRHISLTDSRKRHYKKKRIMDIYLYKPERYNSTSVHGKWHLSCMQGVWKFFRYNKKKIPFFRISFFFILNITSLLFYVIPSVSSSPDRYFYGGYCARWYHLYNPSKNCRSSMLKSETLQTTLALKIIT